jgi:hypothetical protein
MRIHGLCHCGNISFAFETRETLPTIAPRACDCSFCTMHAAQCYSDPHGSVLIDVREGTLLQRYRFGERTADFLLCRSCGAYAGAVITQGDVQRATLNLRLTPLRDVPAAPFSYRSETRDERIARRLARWTPARLVIKG